MPSSFQNFHLSRSVLPWIGQHFCLRLGVWLRRYIRHDGSWKEVSNPLSDISEVEANLNLLIFPTHEVNNKIISKYVHKTHAECVDGNVRVVKVHWNFCRKSYREENVQNVSVIA